MKGLAGKLMAQLLPSSVCDASTPAAIQALSSIGWVAPEAFAGGCFGTLCAVLWAAVDGTAWGLLARLVPGSMSDMSTLALCTARWLWKRLQADGGVYAGA